MQLGRSKENQTIKMVRVGEPDFPVCLTSISAVPSVLFIKGVLPREPRVAIVGSRKADDYGIRLGYKLAKDLAKVGVSVVSGGANGVDTAAVEGCLASGGHPVVVQGTGLDIVYPAKNRYLFDQVAQKGALVSEYEPGTPGQPARFAQRNRIISGLTEAVVIVQAAMGSGSLITASFAKKQGRLLMAVPGMVDNPLSVGTNQLIKKGALLVEKADDILVGLGISDPRQTCLEGIGMPIELGEEEGSLLRVLGSGSYSIDEIRVRMKVRPNRITSLLLEMELKGLVTRKPGMIYCRNQGFEKHSLNAI